MHASSMENMRRCVERHGGSDGKIVDLGAMNVLICKLTPNNRTLWSDYKPMVRRLAVEAQAPVLEHVLARVGAIQPTAEQIRMAAER